MSEQGTTSEPRKPENAPPAALLKTCRDFEKMRQNPRSDWTIADIEKVCRQIGLSCTSPTRGSHYKIASEWLDGVLPIPAKRPIKSFYIKSFIKLADAHLKCREETGAEAQSETKNG